MQDQTTLHNALTGAWNKLDEAFHKASTAGGTAATTYGSVSNAAASTLKTELPKLADALRNLEHALTTDLGPALTAARKSMQDANIYIEEHKLGTERGNALGQKAQDAAKHIRDTASRYDEIYGHLVNYKKKIEELGIKSKLASQPTGKFEVHAIHISDLHGREVAVAQQGEYDFDHQHLMVKGPNWVRPFEPAVNSRYKVKADFRGSTEHRLEREMRLKEARGSSNPLVFDDPH